MKYSKWLKGAAVTACFWATVDAFEVAISDEDQTRQVCSGMYGGPIAHINGMVNSYSFHWPFFSFSTRDSWQSRMRLSRKDRSPWLYMNGTMSSILEG